MLLPDGTGYLRGDQLHPLPADQTYQLWALTGPKNAPVAVSAGVLGSNPTAIGVPRERPGARLRGDVEEHAGGVVQSQQQPIASAAAFVTSRAMPFGVYVHVPFCAARCDYCDFATWTDRGHLVDDYVDACVTDLARRAADGYPPATSVFFGGGTPSLLPAAQLVRILDAIERTADAEVTVECNPDSVDAAKLHAYRAAGVNRLSFGVQSMAPHVLAALGRTHDPANVTRSVALAREAGFERINVDLIYGTPGETHRRLARHARGRDRARRTRT